MPEANDEFGKHWDEDEADDLTRMAWDVDDELEDEDDEDEQEEVEPNDLLDLDQDHIRVFTPEEEIESDRELDLEIIEANPELPDLDTILDQFAQGERHFTLLYGLSDLSKSDLVTLAARWPRVDDAVRLSVVSELVDLAQSEFQLDVRRFLLHATTDVQPAVRQTAVTGLGMEEDASVATRLIELLREDTSDDVRAEAAQSLGPFAIQAEEGTLPADVADALRFILFEVAEDEDESWHVRRRAAESAASFGDGPQVQHLIHRMWEEEEMGLQASAIYSAGRAHIHAWLPKLMEILEGDDPELRFEAVRAVGLLGDVESLPQLSEIALKDEDVDVRQSAIAAIGVIGGPAATRVLRRLMERAPEADYEVIEDALNEASLDQDAPFDGIA